MLGIVAPWCCALALTAAPVENQKSETPPAGVRIRYTGTVGLLSRGGGANAPEKIFTFTTLTAVDEDAAEAYWIVEEQGAVRRPWIEQFGKLAPAAAAGGVLADGPGLLFEGESGRSVVNLPWPALTIPAGTKDGDRWEQGEVEFLQERTRMQDERPVRQVVVSNAYGKLRTLKLLDGDSAAIELRQRVFMNMGTEYELELRRAEKVALSAEELAAAKRGFDALIGLRKLAARLPRTVKESWNAADLAALQAAWPQAKAAAEGELLAGIVQAAERDLAAQGERAAGVAALSRQAVGVPVPEFTLETGDGKTITHEQLQGKVSLIHFWTYLDAPLEEPYGQVGYLDFLRSRPGLKDVQFFGVAVDGRFADESKKAAAARAVRKFKQLMNVAWPVGQDDGSVLKRFGDPRQSGAELPLFVVVGADGKVIHYHAGLHRTEKGKGLVELERILTAAVAPPAVPAGSK